MIKEFLHCHALHKGRGIVVYIMTIHDYEKSLALRYEVLLGQEALKRLTPPAPLPCGTEQMRLSGVFRGYKVNYVIMMIILPML